jgi:hypothetical protein
MDVRELRRALIALSAAVAVVVGASAAHAAPVVSVAIDTTDLPPGVTDHYGVDQEGAVQADGSYLLSGIGYGTNFQCNWDVSVNTDPQITSTFTLTNLSASTQNFVMTVTLPIAAIGPTTKQGGYFGDPNTGGTTYTDNSGPGGDGAVTLATVGTTPFYQALVNGVLSKGLGSFSATASGGPGISGIQSQEQWGTPIPNDPFGPASVNMQIKWTFSLTAGDSVSTKGFFQVEPPEPSEVLLMGMGFAAVAALAIARRRSA